MTRIQAHPQLQLDTIAALHLFGQSLSLTLHAQPCQTCANRVIFQRYWRTEDGHQTVTGEPVHRAAVALHHGGAAADELGHDFAQSLRTHHRRNVHRLHYIGEQHRHLLVLRCLSRNCCRGATLVTELGVLPKFCTACCARCVRRHSVIASAQAICPSKPRDFAICR